MGEREPVKVVKAYKYRIYPTKSQETRLENWFSMCRHLYNRSLQERQEAYAEGKAIRYRDQQNALPALKKDRPWYRDVHSQVLQDALHRLDNAFKGFFRRVKEGDAPGYPKFKKRGQWNSVTFPQYHDRPAPVIQIPKIGCMKLVLHREIPKDAKVKTVTITEDAGKWYACFSTEIEVMELRAEPKQGLSRYLGIDLGLIDLYYASDGEHVAAPRWYRSLKDKLARLQRRMARAEKRSSRWYKLLCSIRKLYRKIRDRRMDFLHKEANQLLARADVIFHEDLSIRNMSRRPKPKEENGQYLPNGASRKAGLNSSIQDASWGMFISILRYKAIEQGKQVIGIPPHYTSQTCPKCGVVVRKSLSERTHKCLCGCTMNRDHAAAHVILARGLSSLAVRAA